MRKMPDHQPGGHRHETHRFAQERRAENRQPHQAIRQFRQARRRGAAGKPGGEAPLADRREQRRQDQARGLVPFACKLNVDLLAQLRALSLARDTDLNELVADLLTKGLAQP